MPPSSSSSSSSSFSYPSSSSSSSSSSSFFSSSSSSSSFPSYPSSSSSSSSSSSFFSSSSSSSSPSYPSSSSSSSSSSESSTSYPSSTSSSSSSSEQPSVKINSVDLANFSLNIDLTPTDSSSSELVVTFKGGSDIEIFRGSKGGGKGIEIKIDWSKFPQTAGEVYNATSVEAKWKEESDSKESVWTGYGKFRISKYVTPNDALWTGGTTEVALKEDGTGTTRDVHTSWISRVRNAEGIGLSEGSTYMIRNTNTGGNNNLPSQYLRASNEGAYVQSLTVNKSLAKHRSDGRFASGDKILLSTDEGVTFNIEDTGNWSGGNNHLDRFGGRVGPNDPDVDYPQAYVVKLP